MPLKILKCGTHSLQNAAMVIAIIDVVSDKYKFYVASHSVQSNTFSIIQSLQDFLKRLLTPT